MTLPVTPRSEYVPEICIMLNMQERFREPLPDDCPPQEAEGINVARTVFRLVGHSPPTDRDFRSQRAEHSGRVFRDVSECQARGLSVHTDARISENILRLPHMRRRGMMICRIALDEGSGYIQQTGIELSHYTWWPLATFDILKNCTMGAEQ